MRFTLTGILQNALLHVARMREYVPCLSLLWLLIPYLRIGRVVLHNQSADLQVFYKKYEVFIFMFVSSKFLTISARLGKKNIFFRRDPIRAVANL